jgi:thiol-disulfide isomerase/thioredoxin
MDSTLTSVKQFVIQWKWPLIVILAAIAMFVVYKMMSSRSEAFVTGKPLSYFGGQYPTEGFYDLQTGVSDPNEKAKILLFYAPSCPHCKSLMDGDQSVWNTLKQKHNSNQNVSLEEVNANNNPELATKYEIKGLPTIVMAKGSSTKVYSGDRSLQSIDQFIGSA